MLKNCLVIMPFQLPWDWSADYQRQTCLVLAKHNTVIAYLKEHAHFFLKKRDHPKFPKHKNIRFVIPHYPLPFRRFAFMEKLNQLLTILFLLWRHGKRKDSVILWIFDPVFWFYPAVKRWYSRLLTTYDCVDYVWSRDIKTRKHVQDMEKKLIRAIDFFFVNSHRLFRLHKKVRQADAIVPQGFCLNEFKNSRRARGQFPKNKKIIGYVGAINHRLDFGLLHRLIADNPQWRFILWGAVQETEETDVSITSRKLGRLGSVANVTIGKSTDRRDVPAVIQQFDVGIIPYRTDYKANRYCYPMKLLEYFYCRIPVISTPVEELKRFSKYVKIGSTVEEWKRHINALLSHPWPRRYQEEQRRLAQENSWKRKVAVISRLIEDYEVRTGRGGSGSRGQSKVMHV